VNFNVINQECGESTSGGESSTGSGATNEDDSAINHDEANYNYVEHGEDWPELFPACGNAQ